MISADILLKGLGGLAVVGGATGMGVCYQQKLWIFAEGESLKSMGEKVGLDCSGTNGQKEETGIDCTIKTDGLNVKQGDANKGTGKKKDTAQTGTTGKIKGYKDGKGFKFVIEEGDITLKEGTTIAGANISKLEQFETYEIEEEKGDKKQYLTRKNDARKEIKLALGLPEETDCDLPADNSTKTCNLDANKIKKINFDGRKGELTIVDAAGAGSLTSTLKISKTSEAPFNGGGYKFELQSNKEITLDSETKKSIKKDTNTEFKIKVTSAAGGPKLTLEKAWTVKSLAEKVGLECLEGDKKECTLKDKSININNADNTGETNKKFSGLSKNDAGDTNKVKYEVEEEGYNQGFKFYSEQDISLKDSTNGDDKKIKAKGSSNEIYYQILKDTGDSKWYLTKKAAAAGA